MDILYDHAYEYLDDILSRLNDPREEEYALYSDASFLLKFLRDNNLEVPDKYSMLEFQTRLFFRRTSYMVPNMMMNNFIELRDVNSVIASLGDRLDDFLPTSGDMKKINPTRINCAEGIEIARKFFDYFDHNILSHFLRYEHEGLISVFRDDTGEKDGQTFPLSSQKKCLVMISAHSESIEIASTIVHEIMHSYIESFRFDMTLYQSCQNMCNSLNEVITYFTELVFRQFLIDEGYQNDDIELTRLSLCHNYINQLKVYKNLLEKFADGNVDLTYFALLEACAYGKTMAFHYFDEYILNPERAKDEVIDLSLDAAKMPRKKVLERYGFNKENLGKDKIITKYMIR